MPAYGEQEEGGGGGEASPARLRAHPQLGIRTSTGGGAGTRVAIGGRETSPHSGASRAGTVSDQ